MSRGRDPSLASDDLARRLEALSDRASRGEKRYGDALDRLDADLLRLAGRVGQLESQLNYWCSADGARELAARHGFSFAEVLREAYKHIPAPGMAGSTLRPAWNPRVHDAVTNGCGDYGWLTAMPDANGWAVVTVTLSRFASVPTNLLTKDLVRDPYITADAKPGWRFAYDPPAPIPSP